MRGQRKGLKERERGGMDGVGWGQEGKEEG